MKNKLSTFLWVLVLISFGTMPLFAQNNVHQGSPSSFMFLQGQPWVEARYGTSSGGTTAPNTGVQGLTTTTDGGGSHSHAFVTRSSNGGSGTDCAACYVLGNNTYHLNVLAPAWDGSGGFVDTVIQIGDRYTSTGSGGNRCQELIYTFVPDTVNPVLLLNYMNVLQNVVNSTHHFIANPRIEISVTNANNQLLPLGYYPNDYYTGYLQTSSTPFAYNVDRPINGNFGPHGPWMSDYNNNPNYQPNTNWPYAKYVFAAPGTGGNGYTEMTPSWVDFTYNTCPAGVGCQSSNYEVVSYPYTVVAFNLMEQARNHQTVKLKIYKRGCTPAAHWAEMYFTAKMVPGDVKADACNSDTAITLEVPWGFKTYLWCHGLGEDSVRHLHTDANGNLSESQTLVLNRNNEVIWPYYCCMMESWTGVPFVYKAYFKIYDLQSNVRAEQINNEDCSITYEFTDLSITNKLTPKVQNGEPAGGYDTTKLYNPQGAPQQIIRTWLYKTPTGDVYEFPQHTHDSTFTKTFTAAELQDYAYVGIFIQNASQTCSSTDTGWILLMPDTSYLQEGAGKDTIITCEERIVYDPATFGDLYTWTSPGTRTVTYTGASWNGCDSLVKVTYIMQQPKVNAVIPSVEYCDEFSTTLSVDATVVPDAYRWSYYYQSDTTFEEGVDNTTPTITVTRPGTYSVTITDQSGCVASGEVTIDPCEPFINLPSAITPSRPDGLNDCIEVVQRSLLESLEFSVYTRTGELIYYTKDKDFCWDGRINGELYTNVTYVYVLRVKDYNGKSSMFKGTLLVL